MRVHFSVVAVVAVLAGYSLLAPNVAQARLLRCKVEDAREPNAGTLETSEINQLSVGQEMLFDEVEGVLTMPGGIRWHFNQIQAGTAENDLIAIRTLAGPASIAQMIFRLRSWEPDLQFLFVFGWEVQSGRCRPF